MTSTSLAPPHEMLLRSRWVKGGRQGCRGATWGVGPRGIVRCPLASISQPCLAVTVPRQHLCQF